MGRIRDQSIQEVREKARIDEVVGDYVTLRNAGSGSLKGLCPFHDEKSPSFNVRPAHGTFHCLAGETRVMTWDGDREIRELAGGTHRVLGVDGIWMDAPFRSYGIQPLLKITVSRNRQTKVLHATDGHRWFVRSGTKRRSSSEIVTSDLRPGQRLTPTFPRSRIARTTPSPFGIAHGSTYGEGKRLEKGSVAQVGPPQDLATSTWFPDSHTTAKGGNLLVRHLPASSGALPSADESIPYLYGWLAGYFAVDGCVAKDGTVILSSVRKSDLELVRLICTRLGIGTYGIITQVREGPPGREPSEIHRIHFINEDLTESFFLVPAHHERFTSTAKELARRDWVVSSVEPTDRIDEVFCAEVEDGHAFTLEDNILTGNCFGCGEGGGVIDFVMKMDGLGFIETIERLADKYGVQLQREDGDGDDRPRGPGRGQLVEAHKVAQQFYAEQLLTPDAQTARQFLTERGFDQAAAETFGIGFSPRGGEDLFRHLRGRGFSEEVTVAGGLVAVGRSPYDRFRGRLMWPIREAGGDTIGFGARRIFDDDRIEAKYLNTSETPIYKKSQVLYGIDLARKEMGRSSQAVVVEGYTDVMAAHLAGVGTAVATCGTAFGDEHGKVLRRFMADHEEFRGEVIFTFDGDAPGQAAALKAFTLDQSFVSQTYVAVEPNGLDPCDLRIKEGDAAVRELVARRVPLYRFVLANTVDRYDLDRADGRVDALRESARLVSSIRDKSKVDAFTRELSAMIGIDIDEARTEVRRAASRPARSSQTTPIRAARSATEETAPPPRRQLPDLRDPRFSIERETLKLVLQHPMVIGRTTAEVGPEDFTHPTFRGIWELVAAAGGPLAGAADEGWVPRLREAATDPAVASAISALAVDSLLTAKAPDGAYVALHVVRLLELTTLRRIAGIKSKLQRTNPVEEPETYNRMFGELAALEAQRRALRDRIIGDQ